MCAWLMISLTFVGVTNDLIFTVFGVVGVICVSVECQYKQVMEHFICNHRVTAITNQTTSLILGSDLDLLAPTSVTTCPLGFT